MESFKLGLRLLKIRELRVASRGLLGNSGASFVSSGTYFLPPRDSIAFLSATNQAFNSWQLGMMIRNVRTMRRDSAPWRPNLERNVRPVVNGDLPSSVDFCEICTTYGFPGMASLANAADVGPRRITFSGSLL